MGQKSNPVGLRMAVNKDWRSKWYADKKAFGGLLVEDYKIREILKKKLESASVPRIGIERAANRCRITIHTARPGVVIGRKGAEIKKAKKQERRNNLENSLIILGIMIERIIIILPNSRFQDQDKFDFQLINKIKMG